jgi:hypothetical protein
MVQLLTTILFTWLAVPFGLVAVAAGYVLRAYITMPLQQYMLSRHLGIRMRDTWAAMMLPLGCATTMAVAVHFSQSWLVAEIGTGWPSALMAVGLGAAIYSALVAILAWTQLRDMVATLLSMRRNTEPNK